MCVEEGRLRIRRIGNLCGLPNMIRPLITDSTESCCFFYNKAHLIALYNQIILDTLSEVDKALIILNTMYNIQFLRLGSILVVRWTRIFLSYPTVGSQ